MDLDNVKNKLKQFVDDDAFPYLDLYLTEINEAQGSFAVTRFVKSLLSV